MARICGEFVKGYGRNVLLSEAERDFGRAPQLKFVFWHDTGMGMMLAGGMIEMGEMRLKGKIDSQMRQAKEDFEAVYQKEVPLMEEVEARVGFEDVAGFSERFLRQDPTGKTLLEQFVEELKRERREDKWTFPMPPVYIPEFVIAGAEFARDMYGLVYDIASQK